MPEDILDVIASKGKEPSAEVIKIVAKTGKQEKKTEREFELLLQAARLMREQELNIICTHLGLDRQEVKEEAAKFEYQEGMTEAHSAKAAIFKVMHRHNYPDLMFEPMHDKRWWRMMVEQAGSKVL